MTSLVDLVDVVRQEAAKTHDRITQHPGQDVSRLLSHAGAVFQQRMLQIANACDALVAVIERSILKDGASSGGGSAVPSAVPSRAATPPKAREVIVLDDEDDKPAAASAPPPSNVAGMLCNPEVLAALRAAEASGVPAHAIMAMLQRANTPGGGR